MGISHRASASRISVSDHWDHWDPQSPKLQRSLSLSPPFSLTDLSAAKASMGGLPKLERLWCRLST